MSAQAADFHGVWRLADWSVRLSDSGDSRQPFGGQVDGYLVYHPDGWVSATLMERNRPAISQDRLAISGMRRALREQPDAVPDAAGLEHLRQYFLAANGYINYSGPFDLDEKSVHHKVAVSLLPQWVGTTLSREYTFDQKGNRLTLMAAQGEMTDCLVWECVR